MSHAVISKRTYCAGVQHAASDIGLGRKLETVALKFPICLSQIGQFCTALCSQCPGLNELQHLLLDIGIERDGLRFEQRNKVVHEFAGRNFLQKMRATVLHTRIRQLGNSVSNPALKGV